MHEPTPAAVRAPPADSLPRKYAALFVVLLVAAAFLALVGAFDTSHGPFAIRLVYWFSIMLIGGLIAVAVLEGVERSGLAADRPWVQGALIVVAISVPETLVVWGLASGLYGLSFDAAGVASIFPQVALVSAAVAVLQALADRAPLQTHAAPEPSHRPLLCARLPHRLRDAELQAVQAEGHYVRVHTDRGSDLLLIRLSQAIGELAGVEGAQTHRSWWVAKAAVTGVRRGGGRARLTLRDGTEAPVSRTYARALREQGWLRP